MRGIISTPLCEDWSTSCFRHQDDTLQHERDVEGRAPSAASKMRNAVSMMIMMPYDAAPQRHWDPYDAQDADGCWLPAGSLKSWRTFEESEP